VWITSDKEPLPLEPRSEVIGAGVVNLVMGMWLMAAPWVFGYARTEAGWNATIVGLVVMAIAVVRIVRPARRVWLSVVTLGLGIWLVVAPFVIGDVSTARVVDNLVVAAVIITEACVSIVFGVRARSGQPHPLGA
jgi:hypothetical protein